MKRLLLILPVVALLAVACNNQPSQQQNQQSTLSPQQQNSQSANQETDWKTYASQANNYTINYPSNWFVGEDNNGVYLTSNNFATPIEVISAGGVFAMISLEPNSTFYNQLDTPKIGMKQDIGLEAVTKTGTIQINGYNAHKYTSETRPNTGTERAYQVGYLIKKNNEIYKISFMSGNKDTADQNMALYEQIAMSFKSK